jgi:hypothetical protein
VSLLILIDGYNMVGPVAAPAKGPSFDWLRRERGRLLDRLADHLSAALRGRTCVVFDSADPPADRPSRNWYRGIDVRYAVGYPEADDLLEELIATHSAPKRLAVVSTDRRVQAAARRRGATALDAQPWLDDLLENRVRLAPRATVSGQGRAAEENAGLESGEVVEEISPEEVDGWLDTFGF